MHGEYTTPMKPSLLEKRLASGKARIDPLVGLEKLCSRCQEYWPQDTVFWSVCNSPKSCDGLQHYCKACEAEMARIRKEGKAA